ncbi:VOC family protein [Spirulina major]|uniref:VOC family protein n=1 Tax=Spirulina major TaxID=270636 RepID=UPI0009342DE4|nr:VOC family protein [Spirulina major]
MLHHVSIRTADIHRAIAFYEILGFRVSDRFTTGYTLACWLTGQQGRLELIQIPEPKPAPDAFGDEHYVGYYHLSFDLTDAAPSLSAWLAEITPRFAAIGHQLSILLPPEQQMIGQSVYEVAFIQDCDRLPIEVLRQLAEGKS